MFRRREGDDLAKALNLIGRLPSTSQYQVALLLDEELAEQIVAGEDPDEEREPARPPLTEWDHKAQVLSVIADLLAEQTAVLVAVNSKNGKFKAPKPLAHPFTAVEKVRALVRDRKKRADHRKLRARLYPNRPPS